MRSLISTLIEEHLEVVRKIQDQCWPSIEQYSSLVERTISSGNTVFFCGNGGSAAEAQHMAAEFVGRFCLERKGYSALALTVDTSILTAVSNDFGYDSIFERQIEALGRPGDLLVGISTSGNSQNVIRAMRKARKEGLYTVAMTGENGGELKSTTELCICVPSNDTPRIQEAHLLIGHIMCHIVESNLLAIEE